MQRRGKVKPPHCSLMQDPGCGSQAHRLHGTSQPTWVWFAILIKDLRPRNAEVNYPESLGLHKPQSSQASGAATSRPGSSLDFFHSILQWSPQAKHHSRHVPNSESFNLHGSPTRRCFQWVNCFLPRIHKLKLWPPMGWHWTQWEGGHLRASQGECPHQKLTRLHLDLGLSASTTMR